ncbi:YggS family pyridoxal phosphate-dependent enzyme [Thermomicrobium sp. 4228-Ro]|uniref:YggS family pyridoxal phosphate-dependent enzyme n=1 Tax=Thermomicrobium sp. 4228-Ro TaxID=2993937 RepID=UPI0022489402|nr:YggS family pyridoxal phosphate-dependent enzyme [Thermomicrobium sp. 4228-Ro]MCX2726097.1 YggS family pyridoxal phosphate-dependent enzyme [Thermomicrobium sp. 4228-Ro]
MLTSEELATRIARVQQVITEAAERAGRDPRAVRIVAVTKGVERALVDLAYQLGLRIFGENRVQEAAQKFGETPLPEDAELHLIGHLQTNKARSAVRLFSMIHSVDRIPLVLELERRSERLNQRVPVLIQINVAREPQKHGCAPEEAPSLVQAILAAPQLELRGLMTIAPLTSHDEDIRQVFRMLRLLRDDLEQRFGIPLPELSMGMTNDFPIAVEEGATLVRIGRALFGERQDGDRLVR